MLGSLGTFSRTLAAALLAAGWQATNSPLRFVRGAWEVRLHSPGYTHLLRDGKTVKPFESRKGTEDRKALDVAAKIQAYVSRTPEPGRARQAAPRPD
jgi:hypothetical protein